MRDEATLADEQEERDRGAHAALVGLFLAAVEDGHPGGLHRVLENPQHVVRGYAGLVTRIGIDDVPPAGDGRANLGNRDLRSDFARRVVFHAISHHEERELLVDEVVILVLCPFASDVGRRPESEIHVPRRAAPSRVEGRTIPTHPGPS